MIHIFAPRFRALLESELPDVVAEAEALGAIRYNPMRLVPEEMIGGYRDTDDQFEALGAPSGDGGRARACARTPGLEVRRGVAVSALLTDGEAANGVPHVVGVRTEAGEELHADLVVDAAGRRSSLPAMLTAIGARAPEEELEDSGFMYYGRHFRSADGDDPAVDVRNLDAVGNGVDAHAPGRQRHVGLGIIASAKDAAMRGLKDVDTWMRTWRSFPLVAHWADGEPLDDEVAIMAKIEDRHRSFVVDGIAGRDRRARRRRLVGVHEPVARARRVDRLHARGRVARPVAGRVDRRPDGARAALARGDRGDRRAVLPGNARLRPPPPRRDRRRHRRQGVRPGRSAVRDHAGSPVGGRQGPRRVPRAS